MDKNQFNQSSYSKPQSAAHFAGNRGMFPAERKLIAKYFHGKILDLGCGTGRTTAALYDDYDYKDVIGIDIDSRMIDIAKQCHPEINFQVADACSLPFKSNAFDTVFFSYNGLDYIYPEARRVQAVREAERVLKPGGYFIYSSHNPDAIIPNFRIKFLWRNFWRGSLFSRYKYEAHSYGSSFWTYYASPKEQVEQAERCGLKFSALETMAGKCETCDLYPHYVFKKL